MYSSNRLRTVVDVTYARNNLSTFQITFTGIGTEQRIQYGTVSQSRKLLENKELCGNDKSHSLTKFSYCTGHAGKFFTVITFRRISGIGTTEYTGVALPVAATTIFVVV